MQEKAIPPQKIRSSNIELMRIVLMVVIIMIDYLRLRYLEPPVMNWLYGNSERLEARAARLVRGSREILRRMVA